MKGGYVYMMCSSNHKAIYIGITADLEKRVYEHRNKHYPNSFTARYNCVKLVYFVRFDTIVSAIAEEKRLKGGNRMQKERLITEMNPEWKDLWNEVCV